MRKRKTWGGQRPGAGRPTVDELKVRMMIYLPPHVKSWVIKQGGSKFIADVLEQYKKIIENSG